MCLGLGLGIYAFRFCFEHVPVLFQMLVSNTYACSKRNLVSDLYCSWSQKKYPLNRVEAVSLTYSINGNSIRMAMSVHYCAGVHYSGVS